MDGKRGAQRRPLSELDAEQVAERSMQGDVVDEVCRRLSLLQTARPRRHQSKGVRLGSVAREFTVFEDPCGVYGAPPRATTVTYAHDNKENHYPA
ncbi:uncharacterized protein MRET_2307 [Malassezia restricta]|uniref:uncharacterized protein n=1 Tax=Malassezia restricta TaxID=76775 RepID=UPI000DD135FD|nr:uncharacterized protein MRET_2307 [Malassezia restricta]AXA49825.1 uncharacterized protein MRET_2307 [Malassezia restricta]